MKNILVIFGGCSSEYAISLQSARAVAAAMDPRRYAPVMVGITRSGRWLHYAGPLSRLDDDSWHQSCCVPCAVSPDRGSGKLLLLEGPRPYIRYDAAFPVLHGKNGEDGTVQGLLELCGAPIIGCGTLSSALCMDKDRAHALARLAGIRVPESAVFSLGAAEPEIAAAAERLGYPLFVKPVRAGSSFGVSRVASPEQLSAALRLAFENDSEIILEEAIPGFEVGCAVLGCGDGLTVGEVDEIELSQGFFDFEEKYTLKTSAIHCPARISAEKADEIKEAARRIYRALDCRVFARVDMFLTPDGEIVFNEVNTIPGFTSHSRYPNMMKAAGLEFSELITELIELGARS